MSDHCSNIAVALIELTKDSFETHEYLNYLKDTGAQHFKERYNAYRAKYYRWSKTRLKPPKTGALSALRAARLFCSIFL